MESFEWKRFLEQWSQDVLECITQTKEFLAKNKLHYDNYEKQAFTKGSLGFLGATEAQIVNAENRLGTILPPSYKEFLETSNGWFQLNFSAEHTKIFSAEEIEWLHLSNNDRLIFLLNIFEEKFSFSTSDENYFVYGEKQDPIHIRSEYLKTGLAISQEADGGLYLLNPKIINTSGEWEAWFFSVHHPGAYRYQSFRDLMKAEYERIIHNCKHILELLSRK